MSSWFIHYSEGRGFESQLVCMPLDNECCPHIVSLDPSVINGTWKKFIPHNALSTYGQLS